MIQSHVGKINSYRPDGTKEMSTYDENGSHSGPAKLIWPNGAVREGSKVDGKWEGEVFYTYAEGPRKGKKDKEIWVKGEMKSSKKFYGQVIQSFKTYYLLNCNYENDKFLPILSVNYCFSIGITMTIEN